MIGALGEVSDPMNIPVKRKYSRIKRVRKPEWIQCPKCEHIILLKPKT